jgi:biopolymer transport protein ExbD
MAMSAGSADGEPMSEMNTTPLIDVMLVLLIMFIITIPVATHAVNIDLPGPPPPNAQKPPIDPVKNKVVLTPDGQILWNGTAIDQSVLLANLQSSTQMAVEPELQFQPDAQAGYDLSAHVLNIIKGSGVTKFGFVGNEKYASFSKAAGAPKAE